MFVIGLDLGQAQDYTALAVEEVTPTRHEYTECYTDPEMNLPADRRVAYEGLPITLQVRHLERFELGTPYPKIVDRVIGLKERLADSLLAADATGVGRPVIDLLEQAGLQPIAITITGGDRAMGAGRVWRVPKRDLVAVAQVALQDRRLLIAQDLELASVLVDELLNFCVKIDTVTAHDTYNAREGAHDDVVLAVAIAAWTANQVYASEQETTLVYDTRTQFAGISPY